MVKEYLHSLAMQNPSVYHARVLKPAEAILVKQFLGLCALASVQYASLNTVPSLMSCVSIIALCYLACRFYTHAEWLVRAHDAPIIAQRILLEYEQAVHDELQKTHHKPPYMYQELEEDITVLGKSLELLTHCPTGTVQVQSRRRLQRIFPTISLPRITEEDSLWELR
jgi:hypothetical protein